MIIFPMIADAVVWDREKSGLPEIGVASELPEAIAATPCLTEHQLAERWPSRPAKTLRGGEQFQVDAFTLRTTLDRGVFGNKYKDRWLVVYDIDDEVVEGGIKTFVHRWPPAEVMLADERR